MNVIDLIEEMGLQPKRVASCKGGEYHSPCPDSRCDGKDRFCIWPREGTDGRYWCRKCLRSGDAIQFCRDFMDMNFLAACAKIGKQPTRSTVRMTLRSREKFTPKPVTAPLDQWCQKAFVFMQKCHQHLLEHPHLLNQDKDRGLTRQNILDFQLGWNTSNIFVPRKLWGLMDMTEARESHLLCLPNGIVIPSFRDGIPIRLKIRRSDWKADDEYPKYHIVAGGMTCPSLYGDASKPLVIVEAELDAMLIQRFAYDICCCIALGGVCIRPDIVIDQLLRKTTTVLFALDFDDSGKKAYHFWQSTYSHIKPWPVPKGKSPADAYTLGVDLRRWVESGLKQGSK
jgi:DNA primase